VQGETGLWEFGIGARIEAPFQLIPLDPQGTGYQPLGCTLGL
jgi:hypothetical protein